MEEAPFGNPELGWTQTGLPADVDPDWPSSWFRVEGSFTFTNTVILDGFSQTGVTVANVLGPPESIEGKHLE